VEGRVSGVRLEQSHRRERRPFQREQRPNHRWHVMTGIRGVLIIACNMQPCVEKWGEKGGAYSGASICGDPSVGLRNKKKRHWWGGGVPTKKGEAKGTDIRKGLSSFGTCNYGGGVLVGGGGGV